MALARSRHGDSGWTPERYTRPRPKRDRLCAGDEVLVAIYHVLEVILMASTDHSPIVAEETLTMLVWS